MPSPSPVIATARARVAGLAKNRAKSSDIDAARRDLRAVKAEEYLRQVVDAAPALTAEQVEKLRALLAAPHLEAAA